MLVKLIVQRVGEEVATRGEVSRTRNGAVANNGVLGGADWRQGQASICDGHRAGAIGVDGYRVVRGQGQQHIVFEDSNVGVGQDLKGEGVGASAASATWRIHCSAGYVTDGHCHDAILPVGNCTKLNRFSPWTKVHA